jgi:hypothetical protein
MKYPSHLTVASCIAALVVGGPLVFSAQAKKTPTPSSARSKATAPSAKTTPSPSPTATVAGRAYAFRRSLIAEVDLKAKTFTVAGKEKSQVYKVTNRTVITKSGQPATMKDIVVKEEVKGSYWKLPDGTLEAKTVKLGPPTEQEKAAAEARKAKRAEKKAAASTGSPAATTAQSPSAAPSPPPPPSPSPPASPR